jgi:hypothetical protein
LTAHHFEYDSHVERDGSGIGWSAETVRFEKSKSFGMTDSGVRVLHSHSTTTRLFCEGIAMRKFLASLLVLGVVTTAVASQPMLAPLDYGLSPTPVAPPAPGITSSPIRGSYAMAAQPIPETHFMEPGVIVCDATPLCQIPLYENVKVFFPKNIAPCAVKKIVSVPDPCDPCKCVFIQICVPPCACEEIVVHPRKDRVTFDYGKYKVRVTERRGQLNVAYLD